MQRDDLSKEFSLENFKKLVTGLVDTELYSESKTVNHNSFLIKSAINIGHFLDNRFNNVLVITHNATVSARVGLATDTFKLMAQNNIDKALVAYVSTNDEPVWRFSYVSINLEEVKGKIKKTYSNPRRYSYVLGPNSKTLTPFQYLVQKGPVSDHSELQKRFSVEVVNNDFYREIAKLYDELVGTDRMEKKLKYPGSLEESHEFAVRLIGRIIFCWFLREKKSESGTPLITDNVLSRKASESSNYYHEVLCPLFFEVLNKPYRDRIEKFKTNGFRNIPYLNGGLFSNDNIDKYKFDKVLETSVHSEVDVPDFWIRKFMDLLERYNFTVDENIIFDTDLSIDPEMLGRVFENLLARINPETGETVRKATGSFYTPREVVDYMVDTSLMEYLHSETHINYAKLKALISYDLLDDIGNDLNDHETEEVLEALSKLRVLDPACGSGAFPIGVLQKIVYIISILDSDAKWWLRKQLAGATPEIRKEFENKGVDYIRKLGIIRQTIFGVDIQPIATEISRLRCFLTLIVDEKVSDDIDDNRSIRPLPNLEFKFLTANTLVHLPQQRFKTKHVQQDMFDTTQREKIDRLKSLIDDYFVATQTEKSEIKAEYRLVQNQLWGDMHQSNAYGQQSLALTAWDPFTYQKSDWFDPSWMMGIEDGFDIIIANPPYVTTKYGKITEREKEYFKKHYETAYDKIDLYVLFIERAIQLSKDEGLTVYITPWNFLGNFYSFKIRKYLLENTKIFLFNKLPPNVFESAIVDNIISVFKKDKSNNGNKIIFDDLINKSNRKFISQDSYWNNDKYVFNFPKDEVAQQILEKCQIAQVPLGKIATNYIGIMTGGQKEMIADSPIFTNSKPILGGKDISRWTYKDSGKYVNFDKSKIHSNSNEQIYEAPKKILLRKTGKYLTACIDENQYYTIQSLYNIVINDSQFSEEYILGILNSKLANYLYNNFYITNPEVFPYIKRRHLDMMPIKKCDASEASKLELLVNEAQKIKSINPSSDIFEIEDKINAYVYKIYELNQDEIRTVENYRP
jgi:type I restriction-modification system DNA methylase subunit